MSRSDAAASLRKVLEDPIYNKTLRKEVGRGELDYEVYLRTRELLALQTPVNELVDTAYSLEDRVGISLGPVIVNGLYPERPGMGVDPIAAAEVAGVALMPGEADALHDAAVFRASRVALQDEQIGRLSQRLPLPQIHLPFLFTTDLTHEDVKVLGDAVLAGIARLDAMPS